MTEQRTGQTSSIGAVWPPAETSHQRMRGFYTDQVVRTPADAARFATIFHEQHEVAERTAGVDRLSIRLVAHASALAVLDYMGVGVEGALPLARTEPNLVVAYTAANQEGRRMSAEHLANHRELLSAAALRGRSLNGHSHKLQTQNLSAHGVNPSDADALTAAFAPLYAPFDYSEADVTELLANQNNTIVYVADGERVVSTAMAEHATVHVGGLGDMHMVEITEASTHADYRGRGLYKTASGLLVARVLAENQDVNVVYGESNLAQPGVIYAAHENGRHFSHFDASAYDLGDRTDFGILQQNFHIADGAETRQFNDFALSYVRL
ncbi:MAG TPA: GNAT family N-acetyltransferase [Candidatus Saccharimonadales bacterium]